MKGSVSIALIVCGTLCVLVPWGYGLWYLHTISTLLVERDAHSVTVFPLTETSLKEWSQLVGAIMIGIGAYGGFSGYKRRERDIP
jgi:hypothetical protein